MVLCLLCCRQKDPGFPIKAEGLSTPKVVSSIEVESCKKIVVKSDHAITLNGFMGVQIINVKDKNEPFMEKLVKTPWPRDLCLVDDFLYIADYADGLIVIDISDINDPRIVKRIDSLKQSIALDFQGDTLFVLSQYTSYDKKYGNLTLYDISDKRRPEKISEYPELSGINDITVKGDSAFLTFNDFGGKESGIIAMDISDIQRPGFLSKYPSSGFMAAIIGEKDYIFVADYKTGIKIFDVKDPKQLVQIDTKGIGKNPTDLLISSGFLYISDGYGGIKKIDFSDIYDLKIVEEVETASFAESLFIYEHFVYVADNDYLTIIEKF